MNLQLKESLDLFELRSLECRTLIVESEALKKNPLGLSIFQFNCR